MRRNTARDFSTELVAVDGERPAGRHAVKLPCLHHERTAAAHLFFEEPDRVVYGGATKRVGTHELRHLIGVLCGGARRRLLLDQAHRHASFGQLPRALGAGEARTNDDYICHSGNLTPQRSRP